MKGIQAFVGVGSLTNTHTNTHTNGYYKCSRRLVEEKKNQRYTGSLVEQTKIQRRSKQLAMIPGSGFNANVDVNVDVDALSSFVPNFSSLLLGSEYEASLALQAPAQTFEPQVNTPALFAFSIIAVVFGLLQLRINGVRDAANRRQEALSFLREVKSEQLSLVSTSSSSSTNENENDNDTSIDKKMNVRVQKAIKNYENALKEELNLRTVIPGVRIAAPNDAAKREEDIAAAKQFLDWDIAAELDTDDDDNNNDGMNTKTSRASQSQSKNDSLDSELERQNDERNKKTSLLMQSRRRFDGQDGKDVSSSSSSSSEDEPMSNGAKAILLTVAMSQIALLILLSSDPMSTSSIFTEISGNPPDNIPLSSWSK